MSTAKSKAGLALLSSLSPNALTTRVSRLDGGARHDWGIWHSAASPIRSAWAAWRLKLSIYTVLPNTLYFLDRIGQSGPPMVADEILEIRRSNPHQATNFDRPQAFARIRVGYIAAHLLGTYCQDLGCIGNREQRFQLSRARRWTSVFGRGLVLECRPGQGHSRVRHFDQRRPWAPEEIAGASRGRRRKMMAPPWLRLVESTESPPTSSQEITDRSASPAVAQDP